jgi:phage tail sheath protein FI
MLPVTPATEIVPQEPPQPDPCALCPPPAIAAAAPPFAEIVEATPRFSADDVLAVQQALVAHCEGRGDRVAVLDPPAAPDFDLPSLLDWRQRFDSSYAAAYFPWIRVTDPIARLPARERLVPMSGHALGQFAAADADSGRAAPANRPLVWTTAVARTLDDTAHGLLNECGINAVLVRPGRGIRIMGARTLSSLADWRQLVVRRLMLRLKRSLALALRWAVFEPADNRFADLVVATIEGLLEREWEGRRLAGASADEAFRIAVRRSADDVDDGRFVVDVAVAPALPAEFVYLTLVRSLDRLELAEAQAAGAGWPR